jgi:hypothetical protein
VQTAEKPATVVTLEEEACDQQEKTAVDVEYSLRSNDETLDEEAHR